MPGGPRTTYEDRERIIECAELGVLNVYRREDDESLDLKSTMNPWIWL